MLRFLSFSFAILLLTAPGFFSTQIYVVDQVTETEIKLEPLSNSHLTTLVTHKKTFPTLEEGSVVTISLAGNLILDIQPNHELTENRKKSIAALLSTLKTTNLDYD